MKGDLKKKRADYIAKNNEILQEFGFSHPKTKIQINSIFNSHLSGSVLWDLFTKEAVMMENTWNVSMRLMLDIPRETHRRLIEPLSETTHIKITMQKRFLSFINQIKNSPKNCSKSLLNSILADTRSITGSNLRNILLKTDKHDVRDLTQNDVSTLRYCPLSEEESWKISMIQEIIESKHENLTIENLNENEQNDILYYLCAS